MLQSPEQSPRPHAGSSIAFDNHEPLEMMTTALEEIVLRKPCPADLQAHWDEPLGLSDPNPIAYLLKVFLYLSSNGNLNTSAQRSRAFFNWIIDNLHPSMLNILPSISSSSIEACIEQIFIYAFKRGNMDVVRTLISGKGNLLLALERSVRFDELFDEALRLDNIEIAHHFVAVRHGPFLPLGEARSPEMVELLVNSGADVNMLRAMPGSLEYGVTPVFWATYYGRTAVVKLLLQNKADVNIASVSPSEKEDKWLRSTPLRAGIDRAVKEVQSWDGDEESCNQGVELTKLLLEAGAEIDTISSSIDCVYGGNATALQVASKAGHKALTRLLLESGADVNAPACSDGSTALMAAVEASHVGVVEMLLHAGARVDDPGHHESEAQLTCLQAALRKGCPSVVKLLLKANADYTFAISDHLGFTVNVIEILEAIGEAVGGPDGADRNLGPLLRAVSRKDSTGVQSVLDGGLRLRPPYDFRSTILQAAISAGDNDSLVLLSRAGIDINEHFEVFPTNVGHAVKYCPLPIQGKLYITPLGYALSHKGLSLSTRLAMVTTMLDLGADPDANIWYGQSIFLSSLSTLR